MATKQQNARRVRALAQVQKRQEFWIEQLAKDETFTIVDGKLCDPEEKYLQAMSEENNLCHKLQLIIQ